MYIFARLLALTVHVVQLFNVANGTKNVGTLSGTSISRQAGWHKLRRHGVRGGGGFDHLWLSSMTTTEFISHTHLVTLVAYYRTCCVEVKRGMSP